ncbi:hypothetical protein [Pelagicoccus sp. SDUM812005]|uniref:hypothetical protein n=1 Tax=Pelagicoccus sp. SDUM812005 TaxID=3041257 RepID=UPI00280D0187|nr:hypothetical protein [Pelagicoccus sp. SDUM812005]MDQ8183861.1 hypothetical protein [Pelagicoccus sp. SDUM812005]
MKLSITILAFMVMSSICLASDKEAAETVAQKYMSAFFHGDLEAAVGLMHSQALTNMKTTMVSELERARAAGKEKEFYKSLNLTPVVRLEDLGKEELYVTVLTSSRSLDPEFTESMKSAVVEIKESKVLSSDRIVVLLNVHTNGFTQESPIMVQKDKLSWKIVMN